MTALLGSLLIHVGVLLGTDYTLFGETPDKVPLQAVLRTPPVALPASLPVAGDPAYRAAPVQPKAPTQDKPASATNSSVVHSSVVPENDPVSLLADAQLDAENADFSLSTADVLPSVPEKKSLDPVLPAQGYLRFSVSKSSLGLEIGRAEHRWEFPGDGTYRLTSVLETSGLAALLKPLRQQYESAGRLGAGGLQPETFRTLKNGQPTRENADFDWSTGEVRLARDGSVQRIATGTQDILSLNYQLAYLPAPENGATIGVVTGRKYEKHGLDSLGEDIIETPAGRFRTLHLRAVGETVTEIWIALDHGRLPVKIRFTDKKGDSFEQIATELGIGNTMPQPD
jgi:hypothetical protein